VDEWLATGRDPDGSERPASRNLHFAWSVARAVDEYMEKHTMKYRLTDEGRFTLVMGEITAAPWVTDPFESAKVDAKRLMVGIVASDWADQLCKCRYHLCGRYFLLAKPRQSYRNGTFCCRSHQSRHSATASVRSQRQKVAAELIDAAAKQLVQWRIADPGWQDRGREKARLAERVSGYIVKQKNPNLKAYRPWVKVNWVTRNAEKIELRRKQLASSK
jgi:hypothetical protein